MPTSAFGAQDTEFFVLFVTLLTFDISLAYYLYQSFSLCA
jgi:hypothetical protein